MSWFLEKYGASEVDSDIEIEKRFTNYITRKGLWLAWDKIIWKVYELEDAIKSFINEMERKNGFKRRR